MEAAKEKSLLETILEQIKIIVVIYGIVIVIQWEVRFRVC